MGCRGLGVPNLDGYADSGDYKVEPDSGIDMKLRISRMGMIASAGVALLGAWSASAQTETSVPAPAQPAVTTSAPATVTLPYGVDDVLKLSRAQVSEDVIVNYVQNSGIAYNLGPKDLVYLKEQAVSDRVVNAMLDERKRVIAEAAAAAQTPPPAPAQTSETISTASYAPTYTQPQTEVQAAPSTVYVIPSQPAYAYYPTPYYGYYGGYYGGPYYYGPSIAVGFAFGGHSSSCWHGSWHGSSWHGGGGWHGGHH